MQDIIDTFAAEYHWSKRQTLEEVYPEEVPLLMKRIAERRKNEALEKVADWSMLLGIAIAPHTAKGVGVRQVENQLKQIKRYIEQGVQSTPKDDLEFHKKLADLNQRRRERGGGNHGNSSRRSFNVTQPAVPDSRHR